MTDGQNKLYAFSDGKYGIIRDDVTGRMTFYRYGSPWPAGQESFQHVGMISAMLDKFDEKDNLIAALSTIVEPTKSQKVYLSKNKWQALGHVAEEMGEVQQAIGKVVRFGWDSVNPELPEAEQETNNDMLKRELYDLKFSIQELEKMLS